MNNTPSRETLLRRLREGRFNDVSSGPGLTAGLTAYSLDIWAELGQRGDLAGFDWAWDNGARFTPALGQTLLVQVLTTRQEDLTEVASWLRDHGADLPPPPPPAEDPVRDRQITTDTLWRLVVDRNPAAITWLAAQGVPVKFERREAGVLLSHAVRQHKHDALPVIEQLVEAGADVRACDEDGENVFHSLARISVPDDNLVARFREIWTYLNQAGADPQARNRAEESPIDLLDPTQQDFARATVRAVQAQPLDAPAAEVAPRRIRNRRS